MNKTRFALISALLCLLCTSFCGCFTPFSVNTSMQEELEAREGGKPTFTFEDHTVRPCYKDDHAPVFISQENGHYSVCSICNEVLSDMSVHTTEFSFAEGVLIVEGRIYVSVVLFCKCGKAYLRVNEPLMDDKGE